MIKVFEYLYFGLYRMLLKTKTDNDIAEYSTVLFLSGCYSLDIFMLSLPLRHAVYPHVSVKVIGITLYISIGLINYFYFVQSGRYLKLVEEHKSTSPEKLRTMHRVTLAFCLLSFASPFLFGIIKHYLS
jgi:hypothetical protein